MVVANGDLAPATFTSTATGQVTLEKPDGSAWLSVWIPALLQARQPSQLRVAPMTHNGELLGLLVSERPSDGDPFTEQHDRVLADLARSSLALAWVSVRR